MNKYININKLNNYRCQRGGDLIAFSPGNSPFFTQESHHLVIFKPPKSGLARQKNARMSAGMRLFYLPAAVIPR
jgi:hypothetical protein